MKCPKQQELPAPPMGKTGWPWTEEPTRCPDVMPDGNRWPKVSIVTPSYNQGWALEETIRSVLLQGYPNLEYIVMDGGSTDGSVEIIKKYEKWITYWQSESDGGQSRAINEGFKRATGALFGWINSDDLFLPNGLFELVKLACLNSDAPVLCGATQAVDREGKELEVHHAYPLSSEQMGRWAGGGQIPQAGTLFRAKLFQELGGLNEHLHYVMDVDLWMRMLQYGSFAVTKELIAVERCYAEAKTQCNRDAQGCEFIALNVMNGFPENAQNRLDMRVKANMDKLLSQKDAGYFLRYHAASAFADQMGAGELVRYCFKRLAKKLLPHGIR